MKTLIKGGHVIDPANLTDSDLDLLIEDGRIKSVLSPADALHPSDGKCLPDQVIDASGMIVCPGFIDMHMHEDPMEEGGRIRQCIFPAMLRQGVTTVLAGNCGDNAADPVRYLEEADRQGCAVNVAMLAGHTWFRFAIGLRDRYAPASKDQIKAIRSGLEKALAGGCMGLSYGLRYVPGMTTEEYLETAAAAAPEKCLIAGHVRDDAAYIFDAVEEFALAGRHYQVPLQVSHIGSMGGFGQMRRLLSQLDSMRAQGLDICADCYPYDAFCTDIGASTYDDGWMERYHCGFDAIEMCEGPYRGRRCNKEIFDEMRRTMPKALTICYVMRSEDVKLALSHPAVCLGSDGILNDGQGHPRAAGAFPRFLSQYVLQGGISLYEGIAKMTSFQAKRLGLNSKGSLHPGADADIVIFDPQTVKDRATFREPLAAPDGIRYVLIGGKIALRDGEILDMHLGRAIRRGK